MTISSCQLEIRGEGKLKLKLSSNHGKEKCKEINWKTEQQKPESSESPYIKENFPLVVVVNNPRRKNITD